MFATITGRRRDTGVRFLAPVQWSRTAPPRPLAEQSGTRDGSGRSDGSPVPTTTGVDGVGVRSSLEIRFPHRIDPCSGDGPSSGGIPESEPRSHMFGAEVQGLAVEEADNRLTRIAPLPVVTLPRAKERQYRCSSTDREVLSWKGTVCQSALEARDWRLRNEARTHFLGPRRGTRAIKLSLPSGLTERRPMTLLVVTDEITPSSGIPSMIAHRRPAGSSSRFRTVDDRSLTTSRATAARPTTGNTFRILDGCLGTPAPRGSG